ncbi:MAG: TonB-dependent receptor [Saprospiraceae bacterium]|nr:TonB-dependent receptor [Candidatus Opimibacter skivensis]
MKQILLLILPILFISEATIAQVNVQGEIKDANGSALAGATIEVVGEKIYAIADDLGKFSITSQKDFPFSLLIRFVGYEPHEVEISDEPIVPINIILIDDSQLNEVVVSARRRKEAVQDVPIPISVVTGKLIADAGAFNVNRVKELVPSVQLYSSNPRNTGVSIRGLGTTFGLTNDGIDPGVGFYVDGVYNARTAVTTLDFIDVEQIEVLRGPQGTLFGKNTTAGAFNVTTLKPQFTSGGTFELSYGNYGFIQAKGSVTGPIGKKLAGRISFSGTQRDGLLYNTSTQKPVNDLNNLGFLGKLLYSPSEKVEITLSADATRQRPDGYAQVFAGVAPTLRAEYRQFEQIIADLEYTVPNQNPFDRKIDTDTPWKSGQDLGGVSINADIELGSGVLTSTTAFRYWNWDPSNDRDFTGLQALALSQAPSKQRQWSQEVRWAGTLTSKLSGVFGIFAFGQNLDPNEAHTEESGIHQWRFSQNTTSDLWQTPGLLDGYGIKSYPRLKNFSGALFGQLDWSLTDKLSILPGIRLNYDDKEVDFSRFTYGGLETEDPALIAIKNSVYSNQSFTAQVDDTNLSGQLTLAYKFSDQFNAYATYATGFKPVGLNLGGLPTAAGQPILELAVIKPEEASHIEFGLKTSPTRNSVLNITFFNTDIKDYQTQVQAADLSVNRGYLANAEKVRVRGIELDGSLKIQEFLSVYGSVAYNDGKYISFTNAPPPLEETGGPTFKDISGGDLPGISEWATSLGTELTTTGQFFGKSGNFFIAADFFYRSAFSSNPSPSTYLVVDGYALLNARVGFRATKGFSVFIWSRNLLDQDYFEQLLPGAGNAGHYAAVLGDPRTYGITLRYNY